MDPHVGRAIRMPNSRGRLLTVFLPGHAAEGEANSVSGDFSLLNSSQKQSNKSKVIGGNSYQFGECIPPNLG